MNATVVIDESGSLDFKRQLEKYLKIKMNDDNRILIKKIKMQRSTSNHLLQLADYVAGAISRSIQEKKKHFEDYRSIITHREMDVQIWPKKG